MHVPFFFPLSKSEFEGVHSGVSAGGGQTHALKHTQVELSEKHSRNIFKSVSSGEKKINIYKDEWHRV